MTDHVLVPVDGSAQSVTALAYAAAEWSDAAITLLHIIDPAASGRRTGIMPTESEEWYREAKEDAEAVFADARAAIGREVQTRVEVGRPAQTILDVAEEGPYDHVVMGSHGRSGVSRIILGSTAESVIRGSPVPITIVREMSDEE